MSHLLLALSAEKRRSRTNIRLPAELGFRELPVPRGSTITHAPTFGTLDPLNSSMGFSSCISQAAVTNDMTPSALQGSITRDRYRHAQEQKVHLVPRFLDHLGFRSCETPPLERGSRRSCTLRVCKTHTPRSRRKFVSHNPQALWKG
jgi:hypothetical protein